MDELHLMNSVHLYSAVFNKNRPRSIRKPSDRKERRLPTASDRVDQHLSNGPGHHLRVAREAGENGYPTGSNRPVACELSRVPAHQIDERQKIFRLVKDVIAGIPAVQNVTQKPTLRCS
jgi:hypothetical protein